MYDNRFKMMEMKWYNSKYKIKLYDKWKHKKMQITEIIRIELALR